MNEARRRRNANSEQYVTKNKNQGQVYQPVIVSKNISCFTIFSIPFLFINFDHRAITFRIFYGKNSTNAIV